VWIVVLILLVTSAPSSDGADPLEATFNSAAGSLSRGDLAAAESGFLTVLKAQPDHVGALGNLGVIYSRYGRTREAIRVYRRALKMAPKDRSLLLNLGLAHLKDDNHSDARKAFEQISRPDAQVHELLAMTLVHTGDSARALEILAHLPRSVNVLYLTGLAHLKLGDRDTARKLLDESVPAAATPAQVAFLRGRAYYDATLFDDAIREYKAARDADPSLPGVSLELARAYISTRDNDAAEQELRALLKRQPTDAEATYLLGALLVTQGKEAEAEPLLDVARAARPDGWGAYFYLGRAKLQRNDAKSATPLLEKAAQLNPDEASVLYQLSRAYKALGRQVEARKASARVAELKRQGVERDQKAEILR
jgi:predicted Zn-dependent protease